MEFGIVANVLETDKVFRTGAKAWIAGGTGGTGRERFQWIAMSRGRRSVAKWAPTYRFSNFRAAWVPPSLRDTVSYYRGTREEMEATAAMLDSFAAELRMTHPNRRPLPDRECG